MTIIHDVTPYVNILFYFAKLNIAQFIYYPYRLPDQLILSETVV